MSASLPLVSVVVPARNAEKTLAECLRGIAAQTIAHEQYEVIIVVDRDSRDSSAAIATAAGAYVMESLGRGAPRARNTGIAAAKGEWIAFTDADCVPSRTWLAQLLASVEASGVDRVLGAAGLTLGYRSDTPAARYVDLTGGLQAERYLAHERYPWAPTGNVMYHRSALEKIGGFDARFRTYEGCDLHTRLLREVGGLFAYVPGAVVLHQHRAGWRAYWRQQVGYGVGYGQFFRRYRSELAWPVRDEARAWLGVAAALGRAATTRGEDAGLIARGGAIKELAQRIGFVRSYWNPIEGRRWQR
ncbi:MAG: glycosyltransferase [Chloroflexota bacterium]